jgi:hypothetical protein
MTRQRHTRSEAGRLELRSKLLTGVFEAMSRRLIDRIKFGCRVLMREILQEISR